MAVAAGHGAGHALALTTLAFCANALLGMIPAWLAMRLRGRRRPLAGGLPAAQVGESLYTG
jgi:hypothetical protein